MSEYHWKAVFPFCPIKLNFTMWHTKLISFSFMVSAGIHYLFSLTAHCLKQNSLITFQDRVPCIFLFDIKKQGRDCIKLEYHVQKNV